MSYCRFVESTVWGPSDVYVFGSVDGHLECCACRIEEMSWCHDYNLVGTPIPAHWAWGPSRPGAGPKWFFTY